VKSVKWACEYTDNVEFSPEDAGRSEPDFLCRLVEAAIAAGAKTINIPDTVGYTMPWQFGELIKSLRERIPNASKAVWSVHCHNDLGMAVANSLAGVKIGGARQVECTINGLGERAGNCSLEEVVMTMKIRRDLLPFETAIATEQLFPASQLLSSLITFGPQPNKAIVGENAFSHEAGIHQDGFLKERTTYEIIEPQSVGVPESRLILGKHSGRHALNQRCQDLGHSLSREQLDAVYDRFIALADRKKGVRNEEIVAIVREAIGQPARAGH
jgi:2-isopropylmalate synthase